MKKRSVRYELVGLVFLILCLLCLLLSNRGAAGLPQGQTGVGEAVSESEHLPYESPIDFAGLTADTPDLRAWLSVPGLEIEAPVMGHETDNTYYHRRDIYGDPATSGSFYLENYNAFDFSDPVTVIYGHNMKKGMFGQLQECYSNAAFFQEHNSFTVYTPEAQYDYQVIAAVPYSNRHILYYHDFYHFPIMERFLQNILETRSLLAVTEQNVEITEGDRLCILSTCMDGNNTQRYLLVGMWKHQTEET